MYKIVMFLVFFKLCLSTSIAQINFGLKGGINLANVKGFELANSKMRIGINAGVFSEINLHSKVILQPEVLYSIKGYKFPKSAFGEGGTASLNYISVPVLGAFKPFHNFKILFGPEFNFLTASKIKSSGADRDVSDNFEKFDFALDLGAAYEIINGLGVDIRYCHGFKGLSKVTFTDQYGNEIGKEKRGSNRVLQVAVFYKFLKNK